MKTITMIATLLIACALAVATTTSSVVVRFTSVPQEGHGPDTQGNVAGTVVNLPHADKYKIVLYAHTDKWFVQPVADNPYTDIAFDGKWSNWTHLGYRYAALVVRPSFRPPSAAQSLPPVGGDVLAEAEVPARSR